MKVICWIKSVYWFLHGMIILRSNDYTGLGHEYREVEDKVLVCKVCGKVSRGW